VLVRARAQGGYVFTHRRTPAPALADELTRALPGLHASALVTVPGRSQGGPNITGSGKHTTKHPLRSLFLELASESCFRGLEHPPYRELRCGYSCEMGQYLSPAVACWNAQRGGGMGARTIRIEGKAEGNQYADVEDHGHREHIPLPPQEALRMHHQVRAVGRLPAPLTRPVVLVLQQVAVQSRRELPGPFASCTAKLSRQA
jgi:hypothetical protein